MIFSPPSKLCFSSARTEELPSERAQLLQSLQITLLIIVFQQHGNPAIPVPGCGNPASLEILIFIQMGYKKFNK